MTGECLLTIGSFAMLCGFSVPQLRHYDEVGILRPAHIDPQTSYRYYEPSQVQTGRLILALRGVDLPIEEIRVVLDAGDETSIREVLALHRERLAHKETLLTEQIKALDEYIEKGVHVPNIKGNRITMLNLPVNDPEVAKTFYEQALDVEFFVDDHGDAEPSHYAGTFGTWPTDNFFLLQLWTTAEHAGSANIGFSCEDLEGTYAKALKAGATDIHAPLEKPGMPRNAYIKDPSGNVIGLYEG